MKKLNNNISEPLVSFSIAKLLKEKEFKCEYNTCFCVDENDKTHYLQNRQNSYDYNNWYQNTETQYLVSAPTQQLAIDWIRINFGIHISINPKREKINNVNEMWYDIDIWKLEEKEITLKGYNELIEIYKTPEKAKEAALLYVLENLIK